MRFRFLLILTTGLVALLGVLAANATRLEAETVSDSGCDKYASEDGSNANPGTYADPFASPQRLSDSLQPGQTGCFFGGIYSEPDTHWRITKGGASGQAVTLRSLPGERATYSGWMVVAETANFVTVEDMTIDGSTAPLNADGWTHSTPTIRGDHVSFLRNDVTNRHRGICFLVGQADTTASDTLIQGNRIHNCGHLPATNHHHGIYASNSQNARILDNWIYKNADRGVQLYPNADGTLIAGNVIDRNGLGVLFSGSGAQVSEGNELRNNIITNSRIRWNVAENYNQTRLVGRDNTVHHNCLRATHRDKYYNTDGGINPTSRWLVIHDNLRAAPGYVAAKAVPADYRLDASSECRAVYPGP
jgi:parallel beta-helix repeat protein